MVQGPGRGGPGERPRAAEDPGEPHHEHGSGHEHEAHDHHHELSDAVAAVGRDQRRRRRRNGFLVALFTVAGMTLLTEIGLRLADFRLHRLEGNLSLTNRRWVALSRARVFEEIDDPLRRYAMRPGAEAEIDGFRFRVSNQGTRGTDVPSSKPPDEKRLLCLGDSFAFGLWCDEERTLVAALAKLANARAAERGDAVRWRALDLGVPGYHLGQQVRALEQQGLALEPDLVLLYFNTNDIEQSGFYYDDQLGVLRRDYLPLPVGLKRWLWRWSEIYGAISITHTRAVEDGPTPYLEPRVPYAHVRPDNQAYTRAALERLAALCKQHGLPLFVVHQPLITFSVDARKPDWPVLPLVAWMRAQCAELGLPTLDLLGFVRGYADGVDRLDQGAPPDFLLDAYFADERVQKSVAWARDRARAAGKDWDALPYREQLSFFVGYPEPVPQDPDFHLTGAGYEHIARLAFARLEAEGLLP